jgi:histidinol-phosphate aminotransferase
MKNLALPRIQAMSSYAPPLTGRSAFDGLLLDFNERTIPPSKIVMRAIEQSVGGIGPQLYPEYSHLEKRIASYTGVTTSKVMVTNGTDQAIDVIFRSFSDAGSEVIIPEPSFAMYAQYARVNGSKIISPLYERDTLVFPLQEILDNITPQTALIVICNPNNPTGTLVAIDDIEQIARKAPESIVYVDEAYFEFSGRSASSLIETCPNIIVSRTFSKAFGLAGLRIGYVLADAQYILEMLKVRGPYDVNQLAYLAASAAMTDIADVKKYAKEVMTSAKPLVEGFFTRNKITFYPSAANFILFKPDNAAEVATVLRRHGIAVRMQDKVNIAGSLRVTVGTYSQMEQFIDVYDKVILPKTKQKYAFLDRDGTLIHEPQDTYQIDSLDKLQLLDGVIEGLKQLQDQGYKLVLVSNQDGLGTSSFPTADFEGPQRAMMQRLRSEGIVFDKILICPHLPVQNCACRKPKTGLFDGWLQDIALDTKRSFVCGDRDSDKELARNLGLPFIPMKTNGNFPSLRTKEVAK